MKRNISINFYQTFRNFLNGSMIEWCQKNSESNEMNDF